MSGSSGLIPLTPNQITATWVGTFTKTSQLDVIPFVPREGTVQFDLEQDGRSIFGSSSFTQTTTSDFECWNTGVVSVFREDPTYYSGRVLSDDTDTGTPPNPDRLVFGDFRFTGDRVVGTYRVTAVPIGSPPHCRLEAGVFEATRQ